MSSSGGVRRPTEIRHGQHDGDPAGASVGKLGAPQLAPAPGRAARARPPLAPPPLGRSWAARPRTRPHSWSHRRRCGWGGGSRTHGRPSLCLVAVQVRVLLEEVLQRGGRSTVAPSSPPDGGNARAPDPLLARPEVPPPTPSNPLPSPARGGAAPPALLAECGRGRGTDVGELSGQRHAAACPGRVGQRQE
jgi:hypothetical protein